MFTASIQSGWAETWVFDHVIAEEDAWNFKMAGHEPLTLARGKYTFIG